MFIKVNINKQDLTDKLIREEMRKEYVNYYDKRRLKANDTSQQIKSSELSTEKSLTDLLSNYTKDQIMNAINQLSPNEREILLLKCLFECDEKIYSTTQLRRDVFNCDFSEINNLLSRLLEVLNGENIRIRKTSPYIAFKKINYYSFQKKLLLCKKKK